MCKMRNNLLTMIGVSHYESLGEFVTEVQKIEEILYQRTKQQNDSSETSAQYEEDQNELQTVSTYQPSQRQNYYKKRTYQTNNRESNNGSFSYPKYSTYSSSNYRYTQRKYELKCRMCGIKGHTKINCPGQYNKYYQQYPQYDSKNINGAAMGQDSVAPM